MDEHPRFVEIDIVLSTSRKVNDFGANNPFVGEILSDNGGCKFCNSDKLVKHGKQNGKQRFLCKSCGHKFVNPDHHTRMRVPKEAIAFALEVYYDGLSLRKVARYLRKLFNVKVSQVTVWNWIQKYSPLVKEFMQSLTPTLGGIWHVDETYVRVKGEGWWYWEVMDRDTRMILGTHLSKTRTKKDAKAVFKDAYETSKEIPETVICDGLPTYYGGLKMALGGRTVHDKINFIQKAGISKAMPSNNNRIERFHNTLKERTKVMRGFMNPRQLLDGFSLNYNLIRSHQTLKTTPARIAGIKLPFNDGWGNLIDWATYHRTLSEST